MQLKWGRSDGGYVKSKCGRFNINPLFMGSDKPQAYNLEFRRTVIAKHIPTLREAKSKARAYLQDISSPVAAATIEFVGVELDLNIRVKADNPMTKAEATEFIRSKLDEIQSAIEVELSPIEGIELESASVTFNYDADVLDVDTEL